MDWQTYIALAIVLLTLAIFVARLARGKDKPNGGCGGCGHCGG